MFNFLKKANKCPYCGNELEKEYKAKFKCPSCKESIYILKDSNKIKFVTKEEHGYFKFFKQLNLSIKFLENRKNEWFNKYQEKAKYSDLIWSIFNEMLLESGKTKDYFSLKMLYFSMALFQKNNGNEFFHLLQESARMSLYEIKENTKGENYKVQIIGGEGDCLECLKLDGKTFTIEEALRQMPIPVKNCTHDGVWCICMYTPILANYSSEEFYRSL